MQCFITCDVVRLPGDIAFSKPYVCYYCYWFTSDHFSCQACLEPFLWCTHPFFSKEFSVIWRRIGCYFWQVQQCCDSHYCLKLFLTMFLAVKKKSNFTLISPFLNFIFKSPWLTDGQFQISELEKILAKLLKDNNKLMVDNFVKDIHRGKVLFLL